MRIAFVGKGGSGKTTVSSLFSRYLAFTGNKVMAIDADINQHLGDALSIPKEICEKQSLSSSSKEIATWVRGDNTTIPTPVHLRMTTPPGIGSKNINFDQDIIPRWKNKEGLHFVRTGDFSEEDVGMVCYHGKTSITEILLNHMADKEDEYVVVDMTAGADAFSTGMFLKFDLICVVVEPTLKSINVYDQYMKHKEGFNINLVAIGNKIGGEDDREFLKKSIGSNLIGFISNSSFIKSIERGLDPDFKTLETENSETMASIKDYLDKHPVSRNETYRQLADLHKKHADSWLDKRFNFNFKSQIHSDFNPEEFYGG